MALPTVTLVYKVIAKSVSPATLRPALASVPIPLDLLNALGTYVSSDTTSVAGTEVDRTIVLKTAPTAAATATPRRNPDATGSPIVGFTVTSSGAGYVAPPVPIVTDPPASLARFLSGPSQGARGQAYLKVGAPPTIAAPGVGYSASTRVAFVGGMPLGLARQPTANVSGFLTVPLTTRVKDAPVHGNCVGSATVASSGRGYSGSSVILVLGDRAQTRQALFAPVLRGGKLQSVLVTDAGQDYLAPPRLTLFDPTGAGSGAVLIANMMRGRPATATLTVMGGAITAVTMVDEGDGYILPPSVVVTDPTGAGSGAVLSVAAVPGVAPPAMAVSRVDALAGGHGYVAPAVTLENLFNTEWLGATANADVTNPLRAFASLMKTAIQNLLATQVVETVS